MTSFEDISHNKFSASDAPLAPETTSGSLEIFIPREPVSENKSPIAVTSYFPDSSPLLNNMPKFPESVSPEAKSGKFNTSHSRQKGGRGEKQKENAKGFKRLLKFGKKGHNSTTSVSSANADRWREMGSRTLEDQIGRGATADNGISSQGRLIAYGIRKQFICFSIEKKRCN